VAEGNRFSDQLLLDTLGRIDENSQKAADSSIRTEAELKTFKEEMVERVVPDIHRRLRTLETAPRNGNRFKVALSATTIGTLLAGLVEFFSRKH
jgi:hypothetical protein